MDGTLSGVLGLAGIIITALITPRLDRKFKERQKANQEQRNDKRDELVAIREEQRELRSVLQQELAEARVREAEKDARIDVLEEKLRGLQLQVDMFRNGLTHPPGFILLPRNVWVGLRARLGDSLPPGPFVGEDIE